MLRDVARRDAEKRCAALKGRNHLTRGVSPVVLCPAQSQALKGRYNCIGNLLGFPLNTRGLGRLAIGALHYQRHALRERLNARQREIKDSKAKFFLEVLKNFSFVQETTLLDEKEEDINGFKEAVEELKLAKQGKLKTKPLSKLLDEL